MYDSNNMYIRNEQVSWFSITSDIHLTFENTINFCIVEQVLIIEISLKKFNIYAAVFFCSWSPNIGLVKS